MGMSPTRSCFVVVKTCLFGWEKITAIVGYRKV